MPLPLIPIVAGVAVRGVASMAFKGKIKKAIRRAAPKLAGLGKRKVAAPLAYAEKALARKPIRRRRTRGMFMRKGRVFMGFTQKEVKTAMRRTYGGRKK